MVKIDRTVTVPAAVLGFPQTVERLRLASYGACKYFHSDLLQRALILLVALTGNQGKRGGGLRVAAWGSALVSVVGMVGVALSGFCAFSSLAEFAWIIGGLFALVLLVGLAALDRHRRRKLVGYLLVPVLNGPR